MKIKLPNLDGILEMLFNTTLPIKRNFRRRIDISTKPDGTTVSPVDIQVHKAMLDWSAEYTGVGFIGEEGNHYNGEDYILCADPLDGSDAYAGGNGNVGVALSLLSRTTDDLWTPLIAAVYDPLFDMMWSCTHTEQTTLLAFSPNRSEIVYTSDAPIRRVTISTWPGVSFHLDEVQREVMKRRDEYLQQEFGCILIPGALVASGLWQATVFAGSGAAESIATSLLVTQAGGVAVDCNGEPLVRFKLGERYGKLDFILENGAIMAANQSVADDLVEIIHSKQ